MAKKYLLYIHDSEFFDTVDNKSDLINRLLAEHKKLPALRDKPLFEDTPPVRSDSRVPMTPNNPFQLTNEPPCCLGTAPCKHWTFDGADNLWRNIISGRTKEV